MCRMDIEDEGCGIDKEDLPRIFERFYEGKNACLRQRRYRTGYGSRQIIHRQNGDIQVESSVGIGTHFVIKIYE